MSFGVKSRREREQEQRKRMARGRRNLSQLVGTQGQGQRTPMNRGSLTLIPYKLLNFRSQMLVTI